jgi:predicted permease
MGFSDLALRIKALINRRRAECELDEELNFHLEMEARKRKLAGEPESAAQREARIAFGGVENAREECRDARGLAFFESLVRDFRYSLRVLVKSPGFTAIAVLSLAIGIGSNTWVFSVIDRALLRTLPVRNPEELTIVRWGGSGNPNLTVAGGAYYGHEKDFTTNVFSWDAYSQIRARSGSLKEAFGFAVFNSAVNVAAKGVAQASGGMLVSGNYFSALGIGTALGRPIAADDDSVGGVPAVVIGYSFWQNAFGGSADVLGRTVYVNRRPHVIVGVARPDFPRLTGEPPREERAYIILPLRARSYLEVPPTPGGENWAAPDRLWVQIMGRLKGSPQRARAELGAVLAATLPDAEKTAPHVILSPGGYGTSHDDLVKAFRDPILVLSIATALTLLIACANLAGLLLARAARRRREICLRLSLGASRARVIRQLLCESVLISAAGAVAGVLLSRAGIRMLIPILESGRRSLPMLDEHLDWRIVVFTGGVFMLATLLFGLAPAWSATRVDLAEGMKEDAGSNRGSGRSRSIIALVGLQAAMALALVTGASLLTRTLANLKGLPLGFNPRNVVIFGVVPAANDHDQARCLDLYARLTERLEKAPGVTGVTLSRLTPVTGWTWNGLVYVADRGSRKRHATDFNFVGARYFDVMDIALLDGRAIEPRDLISSHRVAVVNEAAARFFGPGSPVGRHFALAGRGPEYEVIGVVRNAVYSRLRETNPPTIYMPYTQPFSNWMGAMTYAVRTKAPPATVTPALRAAVREIDPMLPVMDMKTLETQIDEYLTQERVMAFLASLLAAVTLGLACMGVYGVVAYSVAARTREIGIRVALGAGRSGILRTVMIRVLAACVAGLALGAPAAFAVQKLMRSQLFGVEPGDPASLIFASLAVGVAATVAAWLPAHRALRIDPMRALRWE